MSLRLLIIGLCASIGMTLRAADVDYLRDIKPLLSEKCYSCHGTLKQESGLRLETRSLMLDGGAIEPGDSAASVLIDRVSATGDERMPPHELGSALKTDQIQRLRRWIDSGAVAPDEPIPDSPADHWAFQTVRRPPLPPGGHANPIDTLLDHQRADAGVTKQRPAPRSIALRRLYLNLIGLPPTVEQLSDSRPWNEIVDELLASPAHAERWARHWMDVWRYSDAYGLGDQLRVSQKHLWHWRDWIIDSLAADKGYDRMIQEMIAGDELAPLDEDVVAATGFLARNYYLFNRTTWLDNTIEHTGKAFLGLTLNCAKCHDHKYDPITQLDYYRFRALFEPHQVRLDPVAGEGDFKKNGLPRVFDDHVDLETFLHVRGDPKNPDKSAPVEPGVPALLSGFAKPIEPVALPVEAYAPGVREHVQQARLNAATSELEKARRELDEIIEAVANEEPGPRNADRPSDSVSYTDDFDAPNHELWELIGDGWEYRDGALHQTKATRERFLARFRKPVPENFDLRCRYTTTGGTTYKSVTFRFDQSDDGRYENFAYTSAHAPGPKVHIAYTRNGKSSYPAEGRAARKIEVGRPYEIRIAVRGTLVNVWLDGEFVKASHLPDRRPDGFLSLSAFDATAAFDSFSLQSLADSVQLTAAGNAPTSSPRAKEIAEAKCAALEARLNSVRATIAADDARFRGRDDGDRLAAEAMKLQAAYAIREADHKLLAASDDKQRKAARADKKRGEKRLAAARDGGTDYAPIKGALKALETPAHKEVDYPAVYAKQSTGRRLALAKWLTSPENPLTARVAVNHVWMRHFGTPLVDSEFDFGLRAKPPRHQKILDLLAYEFMQSGWSFRHLHRLIANSEAYRLGSSTVGNGSSHDVDPDNATYWRMNARRMESQVVRDSLLHLAGKLDRAVGGPSIDPKSGGYRRSVYFLHSRDHQDRFLSMFDDADLMQCYRRSESIVPQQALALSNSKLSDEMSGGIARRIEQAIVAIEDDRLFTTRVFRTVLGRAPSDDEMAYCLTYQDELAGLAKDSDRSRARKLLVQAILNHNDFVTIR